MHPSLLLLAEYFAIAEQIHLPDVAVSHTEFGKVSHAEVSVAHSEIEIINVRIRFIT